MRNPLPQSQFSSSTRLYTFVLSHLIADSIIEILQFPLHRITSRLRHPDQYVICRDRAKRRAVCPPRPLRNRLTVIPISLRNRFVCTYLFNNLFICLWVVI